MSEYTSLGCRFVGSVGLHLHNYGLVRTIKEIMTISDTPRTSHTIRTQRPSQARPFLKWAGGKQQLLRQLSPLLPPSFAGYAEPFVGSGALFFHLRTTGRLRGRVMLSDSNPDLINTYQVIRDDIEGLIDLLAGHRRHHSREHYYDIRALDRNGRSLDAVERAARTIYLNRTCYNGLYRVNRRGQFNVPMGSYRNPTILQERVLRAAHSALQGVVLETRDYRSLHREFGPGDFVYFDPPYQPSSDTANFTSYTADAFGEDDQRRLATFFNELTDRGVYCMLSNSHTPLIRELYQGFRIEKVRARRMINSKGNGRGEVNELVVLNY